MPRTKESGIPDTHFIWTRDELIALLEERALMRAERGALREVADAARDFMEDPGETNEKIDRLNDALTALDRPE